MAYIPPHKRHLNDKERPSPTPDALVSQFRKNLDLCPSRTNAVKRKDNKYASQGRKIVYANSAISRWSALGLVEDGQFPSSVRLEPFTMESVERTDREKQLALVNKFPENGDNEIRGKLTGSPWLSIIKGVQEDLLASFQNVRNEMESQNFVEVKPSFVARFGKILFHGSPPISLETAQGGAIAESTLRQLRRSFYTNVSTSYLEFINGLLPKIGLVFEEEKDLYHVKLSDTTRPGSTISCKCCISGDENKLELYKVELNQVRHMVVDLSCLDKKLDLRLMLSTKRISSALTDDEMDSIRYLVRHAVLDPNVKGGLRWTLGKESSGDRFNIVGVWHTRSKSYESSAFRIRVRDADRFDFRTSNGEVSREIVIKLKGLVALLQEQDENDGRISEMLKDTLELIWNNFL